MATVDLQDLSSVRSTKALLSATITSPEDVALVREARVTSRMSTAYVVLIICLGAVAYSLAARQFSLEQVDARLVCIVLFTLFVSSRVVIRIPRFSSQISVSDTLIFLTLLLYGGSSAILLAATEALFSSLRFSRKASTILFNWGCAACSASITVFAVYLSYGDVQSLNTDSFSPKVIGTISLMALVQYVGNSGMVAIGGALRAGLPIMETWRKHYLWTSITYFAGASAAVLIARLSVHLGLYAMVITIPIIAIIFLTYSTYLKSIEASASQADQAERHIRELSHYIREQERIREQFSQIEKLSALGELASGVAHDFNNTLAGILGRAQLLLRTDDPEKIKRGLNIIIKTAEDGAKTVKRIQDFARQRRDHDFELIAIGEILQDVSEITRPRWKDQAEASNVHIRLVLNLRSSRMVRGDESELRDLLVNMVFNAVDAMSTGGELTLSVNDSEDFVVVSVSDTGSGMGPDVRSRIFDPFFTTKGKAGMGLGLAVGFGIVRRHEGRIEVDSQLGQGSTFRVYLPAVNAALVEQETRDTDSDGPRHNVTAMLQPNILVVDDELSIRELLRDILESEGCNVFVAAGGPEALDLFKGKDFHAVFTDVGMPGMSGWELAQAIRTLSDVPIAVVTGWGEAVGSAEQRNADVNWVITKPFGVERIAEIARELALNEVGIHRAAPSLTTAA